MDVLEQQEALLMSIPLTPTELSALAQCRQHFYAYSAGATLLGLLGGLSMGNYSDLIFIAQGSKLGRWSRVAIGICTGVAGGCLGGAYGIQQAYRGLSQLPGGSELGKQVNRLLELQGKCRQAGRRLRGEGDEEASFDFERRLNRGISVLFNCNRSV